MSATATWSGTIAFGMVVIPIQLSAATAASVEEARSARHPPKKSSKADRDGKRSVCPPDVTDLDRSGVRHVLDPAPPPEGLPDLLNRARITHIGPTRGSLRATSTSAITSWRARSLGSCAMTSTASSSTTTPYLGSLCEQPAPP